MSEKQAEIKKLSAALENEASLRDKIRQEQDLLKERMGTGLQLAALKIKTLEEQLALSQSKSI